MRDSSSLRWSLGFVLITGVSSCCVRPVSGQEKLQYNRDGLPILADTCFACHGPDSAARKADLRLDQRDAAIEMGAIVPEDPDGSEMIRRVLSSDPDEVMPPPSSHKTLTAEQQEILRRWVDEGSEYQLHWAFIPPQRPAVPEVPPGPVPPRNPIDPDVPVLRVSSPEGAVRASSSCITTRAITASLSSWSRSCKRSRFIR